MRLLILLLFSAVISVASAAYTETKFTPNLLKPDLEELIQYYENGNKNVIAYIHWPNAVTFTVNWIESHESLRINAIFNPVKYAQKVPITKKKNLLFQFFGKRIKNLYFKRNRQFYYEKHGAMHVLPPGKQLIYYSKPVIKDNNEFLSIRYISLQEIRHQANFIYYLNRIHYQSVLASHPAIFMIAPSGSDGVTLEYTYKCYDNLPPGWNLDVRALIGTVKGNRLQITDNIEASQLVYSAEEDVFTVHSGNSPCPPTSASQPLEIIFGVRMVNTAFLAKEQIPIRRMFRDRISISEEDLLEKVKLVEPRLKYQFLPDNETKVGPSANEFQVKGLIFKKCINFNVWAPSDECPFLIKPVYQKQFLFENRNVASLCTNDEKIWEGIEGIKESA